MQQPSPFTKDNLITIAHAIKSRHLREVLIAFANKDATQLREHLLPLDQHIQNLEEFRDSIKNVIIMFKDRP